MVRRTLILLTSMILNACATDNVHKLMTVDELKATFHVTDHSLVPEYEVVHIEHSNGFSRSDHIDAHGKPVNRDRSRPTIDKVAAVREPEHALYGVNGIVDGQVWSTNKSGQPTSPSSVRKKQFVVGVGSEGKLHNRNEEVADGNRDASGDSSSTTVSARSTTQSATSSDADEKTMNADGQKTQLKLKAFGRHFNLTLVPNRHLFKKKVKFWTVEPNSTAQHGVEYVELPESHDNIGDVYQDEENQAAILLRNDDDNAIVVEGSIGSEFVIRPIPERLKFRPSKSTSTSATFTDGGIVDDELFLDAEDGDLSSEVSIDSGLPIRRRTQPHIVYRRNKTEQEDAMSDYAFMEPDHLAKRYKRSMDDHRRTTSNARRRSKRDAPYTIFPEILVIVDYDGYRLHNGDNLQIKRYFISFWNGVDLRYKLLKGPKIRISIAGIIISRGRDATPYLERNRVGRDAIDSAAALTDMGKYLFEERRLPVYDIAVAITKLDMCRKSYPHDVCNRGTAGFAYVGGACVVNKRLKKVNSVAIIEDTGGFSGIIVGAHEVGHLLGAVHDGSPPPSYLGGPGAEKCRWEDGFIMSDLRHTEKGFRWSACSVQSFHHFLNGDTATCLYNEPHEDDSLPRVLPGKLLTLDAQCRKDRGTSACFKDDRVCAQLFCFDSGSGYCISYRPAAEGSQCGDGQYCLNGRCVAEHENIIPDYSQNVPTFVRSSESHRSRSFK